MNEMIFDRLEKALQGNSQHLAELQRLRGARDMGEEVAVDLLEFTTKLQSMSIVDEALAGSIRIDLLFVQPVDALPEEPTVPVQQANPLQSEGRPMDKKGMVWLLDQTIKDLQRQKATEFRSRLFGECLAVHKTLVLIGWLDSREAETLYLQIVEAHQRALEQCLHAGEVISPDMLRKEAFRKLQAEQRQAVSFGEVATGN
ncbi:hypothetical protein ABGT16_04710 [Pseudomonas asiatica]|uniref:hypothetical protein n=1 Tax=Pseudomonas asiatica TaxID=2219225 RepID=UPI00345C916B